jgi:hypothetical protein
MRGSDSARTLAVINHACVRLFTNHRDFFNFVFIKRQNILLVFQQNGRNFCQLSGQLLMLSSGDILIKAASARIIEEAEFEHGHQNPQHTLVDLLLGHFAGPDGLFEPVTEPRLSGHLLIQALVDRGGVGGSPVRHDPASEAKPVFEVPLQGGLVLARVNRVDSVVAAHHRADVRLDGPLEGRVIQLEPGPFVRVLGDLPPEGLLGVQDPVFGVRDDVLVLDALDQRLNEPVAQIRVLSGRVLEITPV